MGVWLYVEQNIAPIILVESVVLPLSVFLRVAHAKTFGTI